MPDFNPFDMDFDGDADAIAFRALDYFMPYALGLGEPEDNQGWSKTIWLRLAFGQVMSSRYTEVR